MTKISEKGIEKAAGVLFAGSQVDYVDIDDAANVARAAITAYLDVVPTEFPASDPAPAGWQMVPVEPTLGMLKVGADARWQSAIRNADNVFEIYRAMLAAAPEPPVSVPGHTDLMVSPESIDAFLEANPLPPEPPVSDGRLARTYAWSEAAAYRAGKIAQAQEDAEILREQLTEAKRPDQRMTLAIAIRAIERGRNLTEVEKMKNLMDAIDEFDHEESARLRAEGDLK